MMAGDAVAKPGMSLSAAVASRNAAERVDLFGQKAVMPYTQCHFDFAGAVVTFALCFCDHL